MKKWGERVGVWMLGVGACVCALHLHAEVLLKHDGFLPAYAENKQVIWPNVDINSIKSLRATMSGAWLGGQDFKSHAVIYDRTPTSFTAQFQTVDGGYLKCTRYYFTQEAEGVAVWGDNSGNTTAPSDYGLVQAASIFELQVSSATTNGAYGAYDVEVAQTKITDYSVLPTEYTLDRELLEFVVPTEGAAVTSSISGEGEVWVTGAGAIAGKMEGFLTEGDQKILEHANINALEVTGGQMCGAWVPGAPYDTSVQFVSRDATHLYLQLQVKASDGWLKSVHVTLEQQGEAIFAKADWARYGEGEVGVDLTNGAGVYVATSETAAGYGIKDLMFSYKPMLRLAGSKNWSWGQTPMVIDNAAVEVTEQPLRANSTTVVRNGGILTLAKNGGEWWGGDSRMYIIEKNSTLRLNAWVALANGSKVIVDGGTLEELNKSSDYVNDLVVTNGGRLVGKALRAGFATDANLRFEGPEPLTVANGFYGFKGSGNTKINFIVNVDTEVMGAMNCEDGYRGASFVKKGAAQLTWHQNLNVGPVRVEEGTLRLAEDTSLYADRQTVTLAGGKLVTAANVSSGELTLEGDSTIDVAEGSLAFGDSSKMNWKEGAQLTLTGDRFSTRGRKLRFGTDANGLTAAQLRAIRFEGCGGGVAAKLDSEGYLSAQREFIISIR